MQKMKTTTFTNNLTNGLEKFILLEDEQIKNGNIYCVKCNTPRTIKLDTIGYVRCICKCQTKEKIKQEQEEFRESQIRKYRELQKSTLLGKKYFNATFENTDTNIGESFKNAFNRCKKYCENSKFVFEQGLGIYLFGNSGLGKTHLFACMINELTRQGYSCLITNFMEICKHIYSNDILNYENQLANIDFLFIDDIGTERVKRNGEDLWVQEKMYDIINKRYNNSLPTLFNSNNSISSLINDIGILPKTVDRICEMASAKIKLEGNNYRYRKVEQVLPF